MHARSDLLHQYGVRLNVLGRTSLLPPNVQAAIRKAEELTRDNDRCVSTSLHSSRASRTVVPKARKGTRSRLSAVPCLTVVVDCSLISWRAILQHLTAGSLSDSYSRAILNLCMPYAARNEMATAIDLAIDDALAKEAADGTRQYVQPPTAPCLVYSRIHPRAHTRLHDRPASEITEDDIAAQLMTTRAGSPPLDLLVRTSGVRRLSDFLLWQVRSVFSSSPLPRRSHLASLSPRERTNAPAPRSDTQCCENTQLQFSPTYWPDFGLWDFIPIVLDYQRRAWAA